MDEFAQSREDDDLFADEFEAVAEPTISIEPIAQQIIDHGEGGGTEDGARETTEAVGDRPSQEQSHGQANARREQDHSRGQGQGHGRGRGNGRARPKAGLDSSRFATTSESNPPSSSIPTPSQPSTTIEPPTQDITQPPSSPSQPTKQESTITASPRTPAVRGDRSATGGPAHKKLTEEELTAKMEKMAILNAQKAERHRLSEADQAAFQHREKELAKERKEKAVAEKRNERAMEMERAKNRERKMKAQGGREWDSEKVESDIVDGRGRGRSSEYVRGGHGGVIRGGLGVSKYSVATDTETPEFGTRGRGSRGGRGGRGGGARGGKASVPAIVSSLEDFPSLPPAKTSGKVMENVLSPIEKPAGDWAEEMATPVEEKKTPL
jgi:hypothetical protein